MATEKTTAAAATGRKRRRSSPKSTAATKKSTTTRPTKTTKTAKAAATKKTPDVPEFPATPPPSRVLLVDNGGDTLKYGWIDIDGTDTIETAQCSPSQPYPHSLPNVSARLMHQFTTLVGDELNRVQNPNSLLARTRSMERGMICNLENQTRVWKRMLDLVGVMVPTHTITAKCLGWKINSGAAAAAKRKTGKLVAAAATTGTGELPEKTIPPQTIGVILLLPPHCPRILLDQIFTVWMEDFCVSHVGLGISSACASYDQSVRTPWKTSCTVDLGWSSTLIVPTFRNELILAQDSKDKKDNIRAAVASTIRRMPCGGRHMINMMKYYMSYRQYNLMDQELVIRDVFERLSYISTDMEGELRIAREKPSGRRPYDRDFLLPDYSNTTRGEIRIPFALQRDIEKEELKKKEGQDQDKEKVDEDEDEDEDDDFSSGDEDDLDDENFDEDGDGDDTAKKAKKNGKRESKKRKEDDDDDENNDSDEEESMEEKRKRILRQRAEEESRKRQQQEEEQVLRVSLERFTIPEVLFRPIDAGLQADLVGLSQAIVQSVEACPEPYRPALYRTVYLVGGLALLPNLCERLKRELRSLVPSEYDIDIFVGDSPIDRAWMGAKSHYEKKDYRKITVSRHEWEKSSKRRAYKKLLIENGGSYA